MKKTDLGKENRKEDLKSKKKQPLSVSIVLFFSKEPRQTFEKNFKPKKWNLGGRKTFISRPPSLFRFQMTQISSLLFRQSKNKGFKKKRVPLTAGQRRYTTRHSLHEHFFYPKIKIILHFLINFLA